MPSGTAPNTSIVLTDTEIEFINRHYSGSKSAAIHKALELLMTAATFELRSMDDHTVAVVTYPNGEMFTTADWQGQQPQSVEEIPNYNWVAVDHNNPSDTGEWVDAIILNGYPRLPL